MCCVKVTGLSFSFSDLLLLPAISLFLSFCVSTSPSWLSYISHFFSIANVISATRALGKYKIFNEG